MTIDDEAEAVVREIAENRVATVMMVRYSEVPDLLHHAQAGDQEALKRLSTVGACLEWGARHSMRCILCDAKTKADDAAVIALIGKTLEPGTMAAFNLVCVACDDPDAGVLKHKLFKAWGARPIVHEAGHA